MEYKCFIGAGYSDNRHVVNIPKGDSAVLKFHLYDLRNEEFDTASVNSAVFTVAEGQIYSATIYAGGEVNFSLSLGSGVAKDPDLYTINVTIPAIRTAEIYQINSYFELVIGLTDGSFHTVSSGLFRSNRTIRADGF